MQNIEKEDNINMEHIANSMQDSVQPNRIIHGEVVTIDNEFAYVNVGTKSEGKVNLEEFESMPAVGDAIDIMLVSKHLAGGMYVFSKLAADRENRWKKFIDWYNDGNRYISGIVTGVNKKNILVDCDGVIAHMPFPQTGDIRIKSSIKEKTQYIFKIVSVDGNKNNISLSRREYIDEQKSKIWNEFASQHSVESRVVGKVVKIIESGAVIHINGIEAFLNKNDICWKKVFKKKKYIALNDEKEFIILNIDHEHRKVAVGLKQLSADPWVGAGQRYKPGDVVNGRIVALTNFGVFVEIEDCIDGLISSSDISWTKRNVNTSEIFQKGQLIQAVVLTVSEEQRRIFLGLKQLMPNPWDTIAERFPIGSVHKGKVKKIASFGIFIQLEEDIDGLIHSSDLSWDENAKNTASTHAVGDELEFMILDIKKDEMKISCGIKQLSKSPWALLKEKYPPRSRVSGIITTITNFGLFVKLESGEEGLVHISEASRKKVENLNDHFKIGDPVSAIVLGVDTEKKRISLSIKHYDMIVEKEELKKILNTTKPTKVTLGDILKGKLGE